MQSGQTLTTKTIRPPVVPFIDDWGRECLRVPLDRHGSAYATVLDEDYRRIGEIGIRNPWYLAGNGRGQRYVRMWVPDGKGGASKVMIARLLTNAPPKSMIYYSNKDRLDLRPENLFWGRKGKSKHHVMSLVERGIEYLRQKQANV